MVKYKTTFDKHEVEQFSILSKRWWEKDGPFAMLHQINPIRIEYLESKITSHFKRRIDNRMKILDIGCGGGLVSVPFARLGADVVGIDASADNIVAAQKYATDNEVIVKYINTLAENHEECYDVVLCLEIIEHVFDPEFFLLSALKCLKSDGILILSTINRTIKAKLLAIYMAEYIINLIPRGTHEFNKFLKPSEIAAFLKNTSFYVDSMDGLNYNPITRTWNIGQDIDINYFMSIVNNS